MLFYSENCNVQTAQNMYEEGDDEMKQTIAKAWSDARSGKTADPLTGYRWRDEVEVDAFCTWKTIWCLSFFPCSCHTTLVLSNFGDMMGMLEGEDIVFSVVVQKLLCLSYLWSIFMEWDSEYLWLNYIVHMIVSVEANEGFASLSSLAFEGESISGALLSIKEG